MNVSTSKAAPPAHIIGLAKLMTQHYRGDDMQPVIQQLIDRSADPTDAAALMDLAILLQFRGERDLALEIQTQALRVARHFRLPNDVEPAGFRLLAIMAPGDLMSNTPLEFLVEGTDVCVDLFYVGPDMPMPTQWPKADAVFIALSESDQNQSTLAALQQRIDSFPMPLINQPGRIAKLGRDTACSLLQSIPGLVMPTFARLGREQLVELVAKPKELTARLDGAAFPLIVRPLDSHAGHGLMKADTPEAIADYLAESDKDEFYIAPFVDYRSGDGRFRKYRIILIQGQAFAVHMGISDHWMIHYLNAGMNDSAEKREEEARFMTEFDETFGAKHDQALKQIHERFGLDYLGIDCAQTPAGELLIFEVHSAMVVHDMDPPQLFPYKHPQMQKVFGAFLAMLDRRANA